MNIVFVCTANICRSVMAEALLKRVVGKRKRLSISSAGIDVDVSALPDPVTTEVCLRQGVDIQNHRPRQLTAVIIERADLLLCLGENHRNVITGAYPKQARKVFVLKEYGRNTEGGELTIEDPTGRSRQDYERCFREIEEEIERISPLLTPRTTTLAHRS